MQCQSVVEGVHFTHTQPIPKIFFHFSHFKGHPRPQTPHKDVVNQEFSTFRQLTLAMGLFIRSMGTPVCKDIKIAMGEVHFRSIFLGVFGAWMTFKKAVIEKKTLGMG